MTIAATDFFAAAAGVVPAASPVASPNAGPTGGFAAAVGTALKPPAAAPVADAATAAARPMLAIDLVAEASPPAGWPAPQARPILDAMGAVLNAVPGDPAPAGSASIGPRSAAFEPVGPDAPSRAGPGAERPVMETPDEPSLADPPLAERGIAIEEDSSKRVSVGDGSIGEVADDAASIPASSAQAGAGSSIVAFSGQQGMPAPGALLATIGDAPAPGSLAPVRRMTDAPAATARASASPPDATGFGDQAIAAGRSSAASEGMAAPAPAALSRSAPPQVELAQAAPAAIAPLDMRAADTSTAPAPRAEPPSVDARPGRIGREMGVEIARHLSAGGEALTVRLNPAEMGRIEVRLSFDEGGTLRAVVAAESAAALDMLRRDAADLGRALTDAGVRADAGSFRFDGRSGGEGGQFWQRQQQARQRGHVPADDSAPAVPVHRLLRGSGRVNLMA